MSKCKLVQHLHLSFLIKRLNVCLTIILPIRNTFAEKAKVLFTNLNHNRYYTSRKATITWNIFTLKMYCNLHRPFCVITKTAYTHQQSCSSVFQ